MFNRTPERDVTVYVVVVVTVVLMTERRHRSLWTARHRWWSREIALEDGEGVFRSRRRRVVFGVVGRRRCVVSFRLGGARLTRTAQETIDVLVA